MKIETVWKEIQSFKPAVAISDFQNLLSKLGYSELAYKENINEEGTIIKRNFLLITPSNTLLIIGLDKNYDILSMVSK